MQNLSLFIANSGLLDNFWRSLSSLVQGKHFSNYLAVINYWFKHIQASTPQLVAIYHYFLFSDSRKLRGKINLCSKLVPFFRLKCWSVSLRRKKLLQSRVEPEKRVTIIHTTYTKLPFCLTIFQSPAGSQKVKIILSNRSQCGNSFFRFFLTQTFCFSARFSNS